MSLGSGLARTPQYLRQFMGFFLLLFFHGWGCHWGWAQQVVLLTDGEYRPGEYVPLRIETDGPGRISIRGDQSLGIDWDAPGKTSVTVPWMTWQEAGGELVLWVNGRSQRLWLKQLDETQEYSTHNPYMLLSDVVGPKRSEYSDRVYEPAWGWVGGVGARTRWNIALGGGIVILILLSIRLASGERRITPWIALSASLGGLTMMGLMPVFNQPSARATAVVPIPSAVPESDIWVYWRALRPNRLREPWSAYTYLFPRSASHLRALDPVVRLREDGLTGWIDMSLTPQDTVCVLHRRQVGLFNVAAEDQLSPQPLQKWFYTLSR